jgi:hypothetical protein
MKPQLLVGIFAAVALLVGLTLYGIRDSNQHATLARKLSDEIPPWQVTSANTPDPSSPSAAGPAATTARSTALPPGTVPAWQINPPAPDPSAPLPPPPHEPPNPALHRPSTE